MPNSTAGYWRGESPNFVVRNDSKPFRYSGANVRPQRGRLTMPTAGTVFYSGNPVGRAYKVSYNRQSMPASDPLGFSSPLNTR